MRLATTSLLLALLLGGGALQAEAPRDSAESADTIRLRAAGLVEEGRMGEAAAAFAEALASDPDDAAAMAGRVRALLEAGAWRQALDEARGFAKWSPASLEVATASAEAHYRAGHVAEAGSIAERVTLESMAPARAWMVLGLVREAEGDGKNGEAFLEKALAMAPDDPLVLYYSAGGAPTSAQAVERLRRYLTLAPGENVRKEAARGLISLLDALGDKDVWVQASRPERVVLPLLPIVQPQHPRAILGFAIEASIGGGKPVRLLLDTGATGLVLLDRLAPRDGVTPLPSRTLFGLGGDQRREARDVLIDEVAFGELKFTDALVQLTDRELHPSGRYQGIVGIELFAGYRIVVDLHRSQLELDSAPGDARGAPYWNVGGKILVGAGVPDGPGGLFAIDTGACTSFLGRGYLSLLQKSTPNSDTPIAGFAGRGEARIARGRNLRFESLSTRGGALPVVDLSLLSQLAGVEVSGLLGLDLWRDRRIVLDTRSHRIYVEERDRGRKN